MLLNPEDAQLARNVLDSANSSADRSKKKVVCDREGHYVALLAAEKKEGQFDTVRIIDVRTVGDRPCNDYADERRAIMTFDLRSYSIKRLAFARQASSIDRADVPDFIYLQSADSDVIYRLAWKPDKIRSMLCDILLKQNGNRVPSVDDLPISVDVRAILSKVVKYAYAPAAICKD
jgi:hypothetical protein